MEAILKEHADKGQGTIRLDLEYQPGVALVTIDNPERHNALSGKMMVDFHHVVNQLEKNVNKLVAVIFMGGGSPVKSLCAGLDLAFAREHLKSPENTLGINQLMYDTAHRISQLPLITIAIATGGSIGGGSELITAFDYICMSKESGFVHFVQTRMGVSSPWGGISRLIDIVGRKTALRWMAGGFKVKAEEGYQAGFVDLVVEKDEDCLNETLNFLKPFLVDERTQQNGNPNAVRGMKKLSIKKNSDWDFVSEVLKSTVFAKL